MKIEPFLIHIYSIYKAIERGFILILRKRIKFNLKTRFPFFEYDVIHRLVPSISDTAYLLKHSNSIPKIIWIYWDQGFVNSPLICRLCLESWKKMNSEWDVIELNDNNIGSFVNCNEKILKRKNNNTISAALFSDYLRLKILREKGGVWADSTVFCNLPLNDWLRLVSISGFFAFSNPDYDRIISSWFIACNKKNCVVSVWLNMLEDYLCSGYKLKHYYVMHLIFGLVLKKNKIAKDIWKNMPKIRADYPHLLLLTGFDSECQRVNTQLLNEAIVPVYKLDHKRFRGRNLSGTALGKLLGVDQL